MKRKRSPDDDSDASQHGSPQLWTLPALGGDDLPAAPSPVLSTAPHTKRRRTSALERGFAHLSLSRNPHAGAYTHTNAPFATAAFVAEPTIELPADDAPAVPIEVEMSPLELEPEISELPAPDYRAPLLASSVVEFEGDSPLPGTQEIKMKGTSWYEPEKDRIVITDLDEYDTDAEGSDDDYKQEVESHPDADEFADSNASFTVSSALLAHIKKARAQFPPFPTHADHSQAVILFKPLLPASSLLLGNEEDDGNSSTGTPVTHVSQDFPDDDAMDVEP